MNLGFQWRIIVAAFQIDKYAKICSLSNKKYGIQRSTARYFNNHNILNGINNKENIIQARNYYGWAYDHYVTMFFVSVFVRLVPLHY